MLLTFIRTAIGPIDVFFAMISCYALLFYIIKTPLLLDPPLATGGVYAKQNLDVETARRYQARLLAYMAEHRPFLDEGLNLRRLAELTAIPAHHLSIVINRELQMNFYNFINTYRVEEAKRLLRSEAHRGDSLIAICFAAGFQSRAAFNSAFKRVEGITPGEFKKLQV